MSANPYQSYLESEVLSADPIKLVQLLYRGAIDAIESARRHLQQGDIAARGRAITKAAHIVVELGQSLDMDKGGALSQSLYELYSYILKRLGQAHCEQDDAALAECARLLQTLLEGWQACVPPSVQPGPAEIRESGLLVNY